MWLSFEGTRGANLGMRGDDKEDDEGIEDIEDFGIGIISGHSFTNFRYSKRVILFSIKTETSFSTRRVATVGLRVAIVPWGDTIWDLID